MQIPWGTIPDWVEAIGTTGALLLGFYLLLREQRKEERAQAERFAYWVVEDALFHKLGEKDATFSAFIRNGSDAVVTEVEISLVPRRSRRRDMYSPAPPISRPVGHSGRFPMLRPGDEIELRFPAVEENLPSKKVLEISFFDSRNRLWILHSLKGLKRA
jgi:hypothetical protein